MTNFRILDWRPLANSLIGLAKVELPIGLLIADLTVLSGKNDPWASPPSKPMVSRDGVVSTDSTIEIRYVPVIEFSSKKIRNRFSDSVIEALRHAHPEALNGAP